MVLNRRSLLLLWLAAAGCSDAWAQFAPAGAIDITQYPYSAVPNDGIDDRAAINAAAAEAGVTTGKLYIPAGKFHATRPTTPGLNVSIPITYSNLEIVGEGQGASTIAMLGTGMLPGYPNPGTWKLMQIGGGAANVRIHDLALEGGIEVAHTEEQTHLLETGHSTGAHVYSVTSTMPQRLAPEGTVSCHLAPNGQMCERPVELGGPDPYLCHPHVPPIPENPPALNRAMCSVADNGDGTSTWTLVGWFGGGDCFRYFGEPETPIRNALFDGVHGTDCDRSTFGLQRGIIDDHPGSTDDGSWGLIVRNSSGVTRYDSVIDTEMTGAVGGSGILFDGVEVSRGEGAGGSYTVTLGGSGTGVTSGVHDCRGGTIPDGSLRLIDVDKYTVRNCIVNSGISLEGTVDVRKRGNLVEFLNCQFIRPAGALDAPVLYITHQSGASPTEVRLIDTWIDQHTVGPAVRIFGLKNFSMVRGGIRYHAAPWNPPTNASEAAAIVANSVPGGGRVDTVTLSNVELVAPPGSFASLIQQGAGSDFPQGRRVSLVNVKVSGLRDQVVNFKGVAPARFYASRVDAGGMDLCAGSAGCP